jgi:tetratricopeptide (TPR) repeat protein
LTFTADDDDLMSESQLIAPAMIYFKSSQYQQSYEQFLNYLKKFPKGVNAEKAEFFLGRCRYEQASDIAITKEALDQFKKLIKKYPDGDYKGDAFYWSGKSFLKLAELTTDQKEIIKHYEAARKEFDSILDRLPRGELDFNNRYTRAVTLGLLGDIQDKDPRKQEFYKNAVRSFELLITNYSNTKTKYKAEAKLIEYLYKARNYDRAISESSEFEKSYPKSKTIATVLYYHAESLYYSGLLREAVDKYEDSFKKYSSGDMTDKTLLYNSKLGAAWSYFRLSSSVSGTSRKKYLVPASTAFKRALENMPRKDVRYNQTKYKLSECQVYLGEYREALSILYDLLETKGFYVKASFLAGKASNGIKDHKSSKSYFNKAILEAKKQNNIQLLLEAYIELADIEMKTENPARAFYIFNEAITTAHTIRDKTALAEAKFGAAESLLSIGKMSSENNQYVEKVFNHFLYTLFSSTTNPLTTAAHAERLKNSYDSSLLEFEDKIKMLEKALSIIDYETDTAESIRYDELFYLKGRIIAAIADRKAMLQDTGAPGAKVSDIQGKTLEGNYIAAMKAFKRSISANPRGRYASKTLLELSRSLYNLGNIMSNFAIKLNQQDQSSIAEVYQEKSHNYLSQLPEYLIRIQSLESELSTLLSSKHLLGNSYISLNMLSNAETIFRELLNEPRMPMQLRLDSAGSLAEILGRQGRNDEAINILKPYIKANLSRSIILQAGSLYMKNSFFTKAINIFKIINNYSSPKTKKERRLQANILLKLYQASLNLIAISNEYIKNRSRLAENIKGLEKIAELYPDTPSASQALITIGNHFISEKSYPKSIRIAQRGLKLFHSGESRQEMFLLLGNTYMALGDNYNLNGDMPKSIDSYKKSMANYRQVEILKYESSRGKTFKAEAIFGIAKAYQKINEEDKAIGRYAYVFAHYPELVHLSDKSRIAAARIMIRKKQHKQALNILQGVLEKNKIQDLIKKVETLVPGHESRKGRDM